MANEIDALLQETREFPPKRPSARTPTSMILPSKPYVVAPFPMVRGDPHQGDVRELPVELQESDFHAQRVNRTVRGKLLTLRRLEVASPTIASWNQILRWLREIDALRREAA